MLSRAREICLGSTHRTFLSIFVFTFLTKLLFAWRSGIRLGWQDEIAWEKTAVTSTFLQTVTSYDAGYPTPLLRALSFLLTHTKSEDFLLWHLSVLLIISLCTSSLAFSRQISLNKRLMFGSLLATYPSFDLLLLHNLSYWTFIPLFVVLTNRLNSEDNLSKRTRATILILLVSTSKPQLLVSLLSLCVYLMLKKKMTWFDSFSVLVVLSVLLSMGRLSQTPITLDLDIESLVNFPLTIASHFTNVMLPAFTLCIYFAGRIIDLPIISFYFVCSSLLFGWFYYRNRKIKNYSFAFVSFVAFSVYSLGLYFFANSGWSQDHLLSSVIYTSLFSRHYLPIILLVSSVLISIIKRERLMNVVLVSAVIQNLLMQIFLFTRLYAPV
jgi:hypothetical protein